MASCLLLFRFFNCTPFSELHFEARQNGHTDCSLPVFLLSSDIFLFCLAAIAYVLVGSGLYDEAIRHFSTMLQVMLSLGM